MLQTDVFQNVQLINGNYKKNIYVKNGNFNFWCKQCIFLFMEKDNFSSNTKKEKTPFFKNGVFQLGT